MELYSLYRALKKHYSLPKKWWPARSKFEIMAGSILTQNTAWRNAELAIKNLHAANMISPEKLADAKLNQIKKLVKPAGFYNQKAARLRGLSAFLMEKYNGDLNKFFKRPVWRIREELLDMKGIGPETADSILLYAGNKPVFVVDAYTFRTINRVYGTKIDGYEEMQNHFYKSIPHNAKLLKEFHALLVEHAKQTCKKNPLCRACPAANACASRRIS